MGVASLHKSLGAQVIGFCIPAQVNGCSIPKQANVTAFQCKSMGAASGCIVCSTLGRFDALSVKEPEASSFEPQWRIQGLIPSASPVEKAGGWAV